MLRALDDLPRAVLAAASRRMRVALRRPGSQGPLDPPVSRRLPVPRCCGPV